MRESYAVLFRMLLSLLLTVAVETAAALLLGVRKKRDLLSVVLINGVTNPIINFAMLLVTFAFPYGSHRVIYYLFLFAFEIAVVFWEYKFYQKRLAYNRLGPLPFSLILNAASVALGLALTTAVRLIHGA